MTKITISQVKFAVVSVVILALIGLATFTITAIKDYGKEQYQAGYDSRAVEVLQAKEEAAAAIKKLKNQQREKVNVLEENLEKSRRRSEQLAAQIRNTQFECNDLGSEFVKLFNLGSKGGLPTD